MGELPLVKGELVISGTTAYVPQEAWLVPASVQTNILLQADLDAQRYQDSIDVCQLQPVSLLSSETKFLIFVSLKVMFHKGYSLWIAPWKFVYEAGPFRSGRICLVIANWRL